MGFNVGMQTILYYFIQNSRGFTTNKIVTMCLIRNIVLQITFFANKTFNIVLHSTIILVTMYIDFNITNDINYNTYNFKCLCGIDESTS